MRTHVILPEDLVEAIDKEAGKGKRSQFIEEAIREKLRIDALRAALEATAGAFSASEPSPWDNPKTVASRLHYSRRPSE